MKVGMGINYSMGVGYVPIPESIVCLDITGSIWSVILRIPSFSIMIRFLGKKKGKGTNLSYIRSFITTIYFNLMERDNRIYAPRSVMKYTKEHLHST